MVIEVSTLNISQITGNFFLSFVSTDDSDSEGGKCPHSLCSDSFNKSVNVFVLMTGHCCPPQMEKHSLLTLQDSPLCLTRPPGELNVEDTFLVV